jgi:hypothetical protein
MSEVRSPPEISSPDAMWLDASLRGEQTDAPARAARHDRDHLLERLRNLRAILPVLATELASTRRQAARLRVENRRLAEQLRRAQGRDDRARASESVRRQLGGQSRGRGASGAS